MHYLVYRVWVIDTHIHTSTHRWDNNDSDPKEYSLTTSHNVTDVARNISSEEMDTMIHTLSRWSDSRKEILRSPLVVRAISAGKVQARKIHRFRRGEKLVNSVLKSKHQTSQAKGCVTKTLQKLNLSRMAFWQRGSWLFDNVVRGFWQRGSWLFGNVVRGFSATWFVTFWQRGSWLYCNVVRGFLTTWFVTFLQRGSWLDGNVVRGLLATWFVAFWQRCSWIFGNVVRGFIATWFVVFGNVVRGFFATWFVTYWQRGSWLVCLMRLWKKF